MADYCVCCGAIVPECRMVCRTCELKYGDNNGTKKIIYRRLTLIP